MASTTTDSARRANRHHGAAVHVTHEPTLPPSETSDLGSSRPRARQWQRRYQLGLLTTDFAAAAIGTFVAASLRWDEDASRALGVPAVAVAALGAAWWVSVLFLRGAYDRGALGFGIDEFRRVLNSGVHLLAGAAILAYGFNASLSRIFVFGSLLLTLALTMTSRYILRRVVHHERKIGKALYRVLIIGNRASVHDLATHFARSPEAGYAVAGAFMPYPGREPLAVNGEEIPYLGRPQDVSSVLDRTDVDVVAIADTSVLTRSEVRSLAWNLTGKDTELVVAPAIADLAGPRISVNPVAGLPLLHVDEPRFNRGTRVLKTVIEGGIAAAAMVLLSPLLAGIAFLIKLTSPGPVLFKQERVGLNGETFKMCKFRSMVPDAEARLAEIKDQNEHDGVLFKIQADPRITPIGKWLRRFSLDELPQICHVVTGRMALVGPRPPLPSEVEQYDEVVRRRLLVRPGLTGLWQVSGRADLSWEESVRLDVYYVDNWSLSLDCLIVLKTISAVLKGRGAY